MTDAEHKRFIQGFALAIASLAKWHDKPTLAVDLAKINGLGIQDFRDAEVDESDLNVLEEAFNDG